MSRTQFFHKVFIFFFSLKTAKQTIFVSKQMGKRLILISNFQNCHATTAAIALYRFIVCIKTFYYQWLIAYALETFACWISARTLVHFTMAKEFRWRKKDGCGNLCELLTLLSWFNLHKFASFASFFFKKLVFEASVPT